MARVPLAQIPNLPQAGGQPITASGPGQAPDISTLARQNLLQQTHDINDFSGPARAMQDVGEAVARAGQKVGAALNDFAEKRQRIRDLTAGNKMEEERASLSADVAVKMEGKTGDQYVPIFTQAYKEREPIFESYLKSASPEAQAEIRGRQGVWYETTLGQLKIDGVKKSLSDSRDVNNAAIERAYVNGDYEGMHAKINIGEANNLYSPAEAEQMRSDYSDRQQNDLIATAIAENPPAAEKAHKEGKFGPMSESRNKAVQYRIARAVKIDASDSFVAAQKMQDDGRSIDQIKQTFGDRLPEQKATLLERRAAAVRSYDPATDGPLAAQVQTRLLGYDGRNDPQNSRYDQIDEMISRLPRDDQDKYRTQLQDKWHKTWVNGEEPSMQDQQLAYWATEYERLAKKGYYGPTGRDWKNFGILDQANPRAAQDSAAWGQQYQSVLKMLSTWSTQNPNASPDDWQKKFREITRPLSKYFLSRAFGYHPSAHYGSQVHAAGQGNTGQNLQPVSGVPETTPSGHPKVEFSLGKSREVPEKSAASPSPTPGAKATPTENPRVTVPGTYYSISNRSGGTDETYDKYTDSGQTSIGPNLMPGAVAVNTSVYPLGTVFKDVNTGHVYIATDRHGNADPNVVDFYVPPEGYKLSKENRTLEVIGHVAKKDIPADVEGLRALLQQYGTPPPGKSALESLAEIEAKNKSSKKSKPAAQPDSKPAPKATPKPETKPAPKPNPAPKATPTPARATPPPKSNSRGPK